MMFVTHGKIVAYFLIYERGSKARVIQEECLCARHQIDYS